MTSRDTVAFDIKRIETTVTQFTSLAAFCNDPENKAEAIARLDAELLAGKSRSEMSWNPRDRGFPSWLACVADYLRERMCRAWLRDFLYAAPVGAELDAIEGVFLTFVLRNARGRVTENDAGVVAVMDRSIALWQRPDIRSLDWQHEAAAAAATSWETARTADTRPTWNAARAAARAAEAASRAEAAAETVHEVARVAERSGARIPYDCDKIAEELLRLMRGCER